MLSYAEDSLLWRGLVEVCGDSWATLASGDVGRTLLDARRRWLNVTAGRTLPRQPVQSSRR